MTDRLYPPDRPLRLLRQINWHVLGALLGHGRAKRQALERTAAAAT